MAAETTKTPAQTDGATQPGATQPLRESDAALARWLGASAGEEARTDLFPQSAWRVDLYRVGTIFGRLTIDLTRDGTVDEEWTLRDGKVTREVRAGEGAGERYELGGAHWERR